MGWERLENPKANASSLGPERVKVVARAAMKTSRYIVVKLGAGITRRAGFNKDRHNCHLMQGTGDDRANLAVVLDDSQGAFVARKKADGRYEISVTANAAAGRFNMEFPPLERDSKLIPMGQGPSAIMFPTGTGFLVG